MKKISFLTSVLLVLFFVAANVNAQEKVQNEKAKKECCSADHSKMTEAKADAKHCDSKEMKEAKAEKSCCSKETMKQASANVKPVNSICPVMGKEIDAKVTTEYKGKVYGFCCPKCIDKFKSDPEKYLKKLSELETKKS